MCIQKISSTVLIIFMKRWFLLFLLLLFIVFIPFMSLCDIHSYSFKRGGNYMKNLGIVVFTICYSKMSKL